MGFGVWDLGFGVSVLGFRIKGLGFVNWRQMMRRHAGCCVFASIAIANSLHISYKQFTYIIQTVYMQLQTVYTCHHLLQYLQILQPILRELRSHVHLQGVYGSVFRVDIWGSGFRVWSLGFRVWGLGFRV